MKYIKEYKNYLNEDIDIRFNESIDKFIDWEFDDEEISHEIIGNQYFTDFLIDNDVYDLYIDSIKKCNHDGVKLNTIEDINNYIKLKSKNRDGTLVGIIDKTIYYDSAKARFGVNWGSYNISWNKLCYNKKYSIITE